MIRDIVIYTRENSDEQRAMRPDVVTVKTGCRECSYRVRADTPFKDHAMMIPGMIQRLRVAVAGHVCPARDATAILTVSECREDEVCAPPPESRW